MRINSNEIIYPSTLEYDTEDVGATYTSVSGKTIVDIVRSKRVLNCGWSALSADQLKTLLSLLEDRIISVTYFEPKEAADVTKTFVVSEVKLNAYILQENKKIFDGLTAKFTEQ